MTKYREIKGTLIQNVSADPPASFEGQVWYNTTSNALKIDKGALVSAWSTGGALNTGGKGMIGVGTQTAALVAGRDGATFSGDTELYNGTSWTEVNNVPYNIFAWAGAGTQTAALGFGGYSPSPPSSPSAKTVSWNGTNWTQVNDLNKARYFNAGAGTQTSALTSGGTGPTQPTAPTSTESWNGTNWTNVADVPATPGGADGVGESNTAFLQLGGYSPAIPGPRDTTLSWNGSSWTSLNSMNSTHYQGGAAGTTTSALIFSGAPGPTGNTTTESWNGTNWTTVSPLNVGRTEMAGAGASNVSSLAVGGGPAFTSTEEWSQTGGIETITSS